MKKNVFFQCFFLVTATLIFSEPSSIPVLGQPSLLQQGWNLLPAIPIAGNNLKFQFGGDTWIATVNGENFSAGTIKIEDTNDGSILTLKQTHIWPGAVGRTAGRIANKIPGGSTIGSALNAAGTIAGAAGAIETSGSVIVLEYKKGPPASFNLISISRNDSSEDIVNSINAAIHETIITTASGGANNFKIIKAQDIGLKDSDFKVIVNNYSTITITEYLGKTKNLEIPSNLYGLTVTHIGSNAFKNKQLTSVVIPDSIIVIGKNAFIGNKNLREVTISNSVISIEEGAFENNNIEKLILGQNVQLIGKSAFKGNNNLREVIILDSVILIEEEAFENNNIDKLILGQNVQIIGQNAFSGNKNLLEITIPDSVTKINKGAFSSCGIKNIKWGNGLLVIGEEAFKSNRLTELILPEGLIYIDSYSFIHNSIDTVVIPSSLAQYKDSGSASTGFAKAFIPKAQKQTTNGPQKENVITTITRITLPVDVHLNNMMQFEKELRTYYQIMNNTAGTYVKNTLPIPGSSPYWTRE